MPLEIRILGISGSPRHGNTEILIREALKGARKEGAITDFLSLADKKILPCNGCMRCGEKPGALCILEDDMEEVYKRLLLADGLVVGSPVYYGYPTGLLKSMMDRTVALREASKPDKKPMRLKVGGAISVAGGRHSGQETTLQMIRTWFTFMDMLPVGLVSPHTQMGATGNASGPTNVSNDKWTRSRPNKTELEVSAVLMAEMLGSKIAIVTKIVKTGRQETGLDVQSQYASGVEEFLSSR